MDKEAFVQIRSRVVEKIDIFRDVSDEEIRQLIYTVVREEAYRDFWSADKRLLVADQIYNSIRGLDILEELLKDEDVTEIMINGYDNIFVEKKGKLYKSNLTFDSSERLGDVIQQIASFANRRVNETSPILDSRLRDGSRVNIVLSPVSLDGSAVTIRKFSKKAIGIDELLRLKSLNQEMADFLRDMVRLKATVFVSGGTGSGKTTFLNALSEYIGQDERIISIEDSAELKLLNIPNLVRLETRNANVEGKNAITIRDLIRSSLRMRPDRIIIGEVRGAETVDLLQALNTGHSGSLSTGHSNSARDMLSRLETMYLMGMDIPLQAIKGQIASAIDLIVHLRRYRDGTRHVEEVVEILGLDEGQIITNRLFAYDEVKACHVRCSEVKSERIKKLYENYS